MKKKILMVITSLFVSIPVFASLSRSWFGIAISIYWGWFGWCVVVGYADENMEQKRKIKELENEKIRRNRES